MKPVCTKQDFARRYQAGEFGNRSPTWDSLEHMEREGILEYARPNTLFHVRNRIPGDKTWYNVSVEDLADTWHSAAELVSEKMLYVSEMAPTSRTLIQGEVQRQARGLHLRYTRVRKPMREALLSHQDHQWGLVAKLLLEKYLDQKSIEWMWYLLDTYDNHVVEFSTYGRCWGTVPGMNTVFWEVRNYLWWGFISTVSLIQYSGLEDILS